MPHPNQPVAVQHPEAPGAFVALDPAKFYRDDDVLVTTYPQFFTPVENAGTIIESVAIEQATADPGEKRSRSRAKKTAKKTAPKK